MNIGDDRLSRTGYAGATSLKEKSLRGTNARTLPGKTKPMYCHRTSHAGLLAGNSGADRLRRPRGAAVDREGFQGLGSRTALRLMNSSAPGLLLWPATFLDAGRMALAHGWAQTISVMRSDTRVMDVDVSAQDVGGRRELLGGVAPGSLVPAVGPAATRADAEQLLGD